VSNMLGDFSKVLADGIPVYRQLVQLCCERIVTRVVQALVSLFLQLSELSVSDEAAVWSINASGTYNPQKNRPFVSYRHTIRLQDALHDQHVNE